MRGMGDTTAYLRRGIREIICLALFFFTFLACEYLFDVRMAEFVHAHIGGLHLGGDPGAGGGTAWCGAGGDHLREGGIEAHLEAMPYERAA